VKPAIVRDILTAMKSGQAKWVCDESIHVYCMAPCELVTGADGRAGWLRTAPTFKVVSGNREHAGQEWMPTDAAVAVVLEELRKVS
jgi:hypothetical protein